MKEQCGRVRGETKLRKSLRDACLGGVCMGVSSWGCRPRGCLHGGKVCPWGVSARGCLARRCQPYPLSIDWTYWQTGVKHKLAAITLRTVITETNRKKIVSLNDTFEVFLQICQIRSNYLVYILCDYWKLSVIINSERTLQWWLTMIYITKETILYSDVRCQSQPTPSIDVNWTVKRIPEQFHGFLVIT